MKVTVYLSTYNQEEYVAQALDSILMQKTTFDFEIIAADDCSTDGTQAIILDYQRRFPGKIVTYFTSPNVGGCKKLTDCIDAGLFRGEYLAWLEGDDYWLGEDRLQTLVDFLEANPEYSRIAHQRDVINETGEYLHPDLPASLLDRRYTIEDFLNGDDYSDFGSVFRNYFLNVGDKYHPLFWASKNVCDFQDMFITQDFGPVYVTSRSFGTYRIQSSATASNYNSITTLPYRRIDQIRICRAVEDFYGGKYDLSPCIHANQQRLLEHALQHRSASLLSDVRAYIPDADLYHILPELIYRSLRKKERDLLPFLAHTLGAWPTAVCTVLSVGCLVRRMHQRITGKRPNPMFRGYVRK